MTEPSLPATPASALPAIWQVGDFRLDPAANELQADGGAIQRIEPRLMALLLRLAREPGAVVGREVLIEEVWSRRMVNDEVLSRAIADLRQALGDDSRNPRYIETIPKSGYRLIAPVVREAVIIPGAELGAPDRQATDDALPAGSGNPASAAYAVTAPGTLPASPSTRHRSARATWILFASLGLILALLAGAIAWSVKRPRPVEGDPLPGLITAINEAQTLTAEQGMEISARLSPDGRQLVYTLVKDGRSSLRLMDVAARTSRALEVGPGNAGHGVFLPDGKGVIFAQVDAGRCRLRQLALPVGMPPVGTPRVGTSPVGTSPAVPDVRDLLPCPDGTANRMEISPDGKRLLLSRVARPSLPAGLAVVDLASGTLRDLTAPTLEEGHDTLPRWSADGRQIAFVRGNSSARAVYLMPAEGGVARRVSQASGLMYGIEWLDGGDRMLVSSDWHGFRALSLLDLASGQSRLAGARGARHPEVAGGWLVYEHAVYQADLFRVRPGQKPERMHASTRYTSQPVYSPAGDTWAFVSNREGGEAIYLSLADGSVRRLTPLGGHRYARPLFSADGRQVLALRSERAAEKSGPQQAVRLDIASGREDVLPLGSEVGWIAQTADGKFWLYAEREGRQLRLWKKAVEGKTNADRLPLPLMNDLRLMQDTLVFSQTGLEGLTVCDLKGLACRQLAVPVGASHDDHWALSEQAVIYAAPVPGAVLMRQPLAGGAATVFAELPPSTLGAGLAVHPQEREHLVARESAPEIDLMIARWPPR